MSADDLECPYCGAEHEVCNDDGFGCTEGDAHEMQCRKCDKNFVFYTSISFYYEPQQADCLNGSPHKLKIKEYEACTIERCEDCDYSKTEWKEQNPDE